MLRAKPLKYFLFDFLKIFKRKVGKSTFVFLVELQGYNDDKIYCGEALKSDILLFKMYRDTNGFIIN